MEQQTHEQSPQSIPEQIATRATLPRGSQVDRVLERNLALTGGQGFHDYLGQTCNQRSGQ